MEKIKSDKSKNFYGKLLLSYHKMLELKTAINEIQEKRKEKVSFWDRLKNVQR